MRFSKSEREQYRNLIDRYRRATRKKVYELREVYDWAAAREEIDFTPDAIRRLHLAGLQDACQSDTCLDDQGHKIRRRVCVETVSNGDTEKPVQRTLWAEAEDADSAFLIESLLQQRGRVKADVEMLKAQERYVNSILSGRGERTIQLNFDFTDPGASASAG